MTPWCYTCGDDFQFNGNALTNVCLKDHLLLCDEPHPDDPEIHCAEVVRHSGDHCGPNGPVWPRGP